MTTSAFRVALFLGVLLLTGCATPHSDLISRKEPLLDKDNGLVVASVGYDSSITRVPSFSIPVVPLDGNAQPPFAIRTLAHLLDHGTWNAEGAVRPKRMPTGKYCSGYGLN
jgi:hypothetical protein